MQPEFHSGAVTRPLSAILQLAIVFGRLPLARLRESAFWGASAKYFRELTVECSLFVRQSLPPAVPHLFHLLRRN